MHYKATVAGGAFVIALGLLVLIVSYTALQPDTQPSGAAATAGAPLEDLPGFLYGRVVDGDGVTYEGRLRFGGDQEAFWSDYFNGVKDGNTWAVHAPGADADPKRGFEVFGFRFGDDGRSREYIRMFMTRFGDIARIEAQFGDVTVTLKRGTVVTLDRFSAGDIDDGLRIWDRTRGVVDLDARRIRTIAFLPTAPLPAAPERLHGTVRTSQGDFTGFIQWNQHDCVGDDELEGRMKGTEHRLRYDTIRSIARQSRDSVQVTLNDGREMVLSGSNDTGRNHRGVYIDDTRYGRVLISWDAFERIDFRPAGSGPGYDDFARGRPLAGTVIMRDGRRLAGRLVYDFDESETTETLDARSGGLEYYISFDLIASIVPRENEANGSRHARVTLRDGEDVQLEPTGDLAAGNAGILVFSDGRERPDYVPWSDIEKIDLAGTSAAANE